MTTKNFNLDTILSRGTCTDAQKSQARGLLTKARLKTLQAMEERGGEPTLVKYKDRLLFVELSKESPAKPRNVSYTEAVKYGESIGADLLESEIYKKFADSKVDYSTWSWLKTPQNILDAGYALYGNRGNVYKGSADFHNGNGGVRLALGLTSKFKPQPSLYPLSSEESTSSEQVEAWLTEYTGAFNSAARWRKEFLKFLKPLLK